MLHVECIEEQLEIDPPSRVADAAQLHEGVLAIAPSALNMMERKRSRGVNCVRDLSTELASRHRFCLVSPARERPSFVPFRRPRWYLSAYIYLRSSLLRVGACLGLEPGGRSESISAEGADV